MLKPGVLYIGKPSFHLHESLCLALYLEAPLLCSDPASYELCQKFSSLIKIHLLSENFTARFFVSGLSHLFTNLQPEEFKNLFQVPSSSIALNVYHLIEEHLYALNKHFSAQYCSSLPHTQTLTPENSTWHYLGPIGHLAYLKHKKALRELFFQSLKKSISSDCPVLHILNNRNEKIFDRDETLDEVEFIPIALCGLNGTNRKILSGVGLINPAIDTTSAVILEEPALILEALQYKKPIFFQGTLADFYKPLSPLISKMPPSLTHLKSMVEHYLEFSTLNPDTLLREIPWIKGIQAHALFPFKFL